MIQQYPFFANLLELRREQFERNTAHMKLSKEEKDRRWRIFEQQQAVEMAMAMQAMNGQSNFTAFESTWKTDNTTTANAYFLWPATLNRTRTSSASASNQIRLPLVSNGSYNFYVDWGDGKIDLITRWDQPEVTHTYAAIGTYNVQILGSIYGWNFGFNGEANKIIRIKKWGCLRFVDPTGSPQNGFFAGCNSLDLTQVEDVPFLRNISSLRNMFANVWREDSVGTRPPIINRLNEWDVSSITDFKGMFQQNQNFNQEIGSWDMSNALDTSFMFASYISIGGTSQSGQFTNSSVVGWNVSRVTNMESMFLFQTQFNQPIGRWNVSNVTNFTNFLSAIATVAGGGIFNQPLGNWDTRSATTMSGMFYNQRNFNQDIGSWDVRKVTSFFGFLSGAFVANLPSGSFNNGGADTLKNWRPSSATTMYRMFANQCQFNIDIGNWDVSNVTNMVEMFYIYNPAFTGFGNFNNGGSDSIKNWDVSKVTSFSVMFYNNNKFNQPIGSWRPSSAQILDYMFGNVSLNTGFNQNINGWGPYMGAAKSIQGMFYQNTSYNQPMDQWNTSGIQDMQSVFRDANSFDQNIGSWNVSSVVRMDNMFSKTTAGAGGFNNGGSDSIKDWNMISVRRITSMFQNRTSFNQPLTNWDIGNIGLAFTWTVPTGGSGTSTSFTQATQRTQAFQNFMAGKTFNDYSTANYNNILIGWASRTSQTNMQISFGTIRFTAAASASKTILTSTRVWSITDGGVI